MQPPNIENMRAGPGTVCRRRSVTLVSANMNPPSNARASASDRFCSRRDAGAPSGSSTSTTPVKARASRSSAEGVGRSPRMRQASSTAQAGMR